MCRVNALVVDSSVWADFFRGQPLPALEGALRDGLVWLPPIVCAEVLSSRLTERQNASLKGLLGDLPLCPSPFQHWVDVGLLRSRLAKHGLSVSTPDAHVAQCAIDLEARLWSRDKVFARIAKHAGLRLFSEG